MNKTHGMNHLNGDGSRHGLRGFLSEHFAGGQTQDGSDPLASRQEGVSHGFADVFRFGFHALNRRVERLLDERELVHDVLIEIEVGINFGGRDGTGRDWSCRRKRGEKGRARRC